jgi:hypothetical protein
MNQINFEREFDERMLETFGDLFQALLDIPDTDQEDSETIYLDNGVLKVSGSGV